MVCTSIILLAVQQALNAPAYSGGNYVKDFVGNSQLDQDIVPNENMVEYLNYIMEQITNNVDSPYITDKSEILMSLGMDQTFQSWELGDCQALTSNTFYSHNQAIASIWTYFFSQAGNNEINCEYVMLNVKLNLNDDVVILHREKKKLFGGKTSWDEKQYIPATITADTVIRAFATILIPLVQGNIAMPSNVIPQLKETAMAELNSQNDGINPASEIDRARRTLRDAKTGRSYEPDESLLKLIPPKWLHVSGEVTTSSIKDAESKYDWEFA
ncbi:hypothetical protein TRFO_02469 [Tritrichomonas foetus]|uniref:Uncharacterized protein n=1 Tax=Tritrichomonas foetus TaxID=1144522 RepID=A0A1J4L1Y8_9EUKA|nr:hypothetical protein TRFO_02469 [Tritrichomonas foetus]|eukprot:OHT17459.1 hypothetical protein TRFO_02469 [Tritrichomonas foetus]